MGSAQLAYVDTRAPVGTAVPTNFGDVVGDDIRYSGGATSIGTSRIGAAQFCTLLNGSWTGADIRVRFLRIDHRDIPIDPADEREFLFTQWDRVQETVPELQRT